MRLSHFVLIQSFKKMFFCLVPKGRKEKKRTSKGEEQTKSQSNENVIIETKKKEVDELPVKSKVKEYVVEKEVAPISKPRGRPAR